MPDYTPYDIVDIIFV